MQHSLLREHFLKEISEGVLFFVRHNFCHIVKSIKERVKTYDQRKHKGGLCVGADQHGRNTEWLESIAQQSQQKRNRRKDYSNYENQKIVYSLFRPSPGIGCLCDDSLCSFGGGKK
jgi:hypothetical protein